MRVQGFVLWVVVVALALSSTIPIYTTVQGDLATLEDRDPAFQLAFNFLKDYCLKEKGISLEQLLSVEFRITGGIEYKIQFLASSQKYETRVFVQIWIEHAQIVSFSEISLSSVEANITSNSSYILQKNETNSTEVNITQNTILTSSFFSQQIVTEKTEQVTNTQVSFETIEFTIERGYLNRRLQEKERPQKSQRLNKRHLRV